MNGMKPNVHCTKCGNVMDRISRSPSDFRIGSILLGVYRVKRYLCYACRHEKRVFFKSKAIKLKLNDEVG
jgi:hypothetical protein